MWSVPPVKACHVTGTGERGPSCGRKTRSTPHAPTRGEPIILAIDATSDQLATLIRPQARVGGGVFAARPRRARLTDDPQLLVPVPHGNQDFEALDQLVVRLDAKSRTQVIITALTSYLNQLAPQSDPRREATP